MEYAVGPLDAVDEDEDERTEDDTADELELTLLEYKLELDILVLDTMDDEIGTLLELEIELDTPVLDTTDDEMGTLLELELELDNKLEL
jgi:hypothetical protein